MPVVIAVGVALLIWSVVLTLIFASAMRRRGVSTGRALRSILRRPTLWLGVILLVAAVDPIAAGALLALGFVVALVLLARRT